MAPKIAIIYVSAALYANGAKAQVKTALERTDHWGIHISDSYANHTPL